MKLEAAIPPPNIKFNKICMNYSLRIMQLFKNHPIRTRISTSFPPYNNGSKLDWDKYLNWNENNKDVEIVELDLDSQNEQRHRKKRRKTAKKRKKLHSSYLKLLLKYLACYLLLKIEKIKQKWNAP